MSNNPNDAGITRPSAGAGAPIELTTPLALADVAGLRAGDAVSLSGKVYTARDAAHARLVSALEAGSEPPFAFDGAVVYYAGPSPAPPGRPIGSIGPTTSGRMDKYTPALIEKGLAYMIGKGLRSEAVRDAIARHRGVYFLAIGGAAALLSHCVTGARVIAYDDLGTESIKELTVENMPLIVGIDSLGNGMRDP